jgi:hypothetical protein
MLAFSAIRAVVVAVIDVRKCRGFEPGVFHHSTIAPIACGFLLYNSYRVGLITTLYASAVSGRLVLGPRDNPKTMIRVTFDVLFNLAWRPTVPRCLGKIKTRCRSLSGRSPEGWPRSLEFYGCVQRSAPRSSLLATVTGGPFGRTFAVHGPNRSRVPRR